MANAELPGDAPRWALRSGRPLPGRPDGVVAWSQCGVAGILNVTPDSFSDGGLYSSVSGAVNHARQMVADGAMIIDVGGESTRPGAIRLETRVELARVLPVVQALVADGEVLVSIDTRNAHVARVAIEAGAHIVNDVTGLQDPAMVEVCAASATPAIVMHMLGDPTTMQLNPTYGDVVAEVAGFLARQATMALAAGVPSVIIDPGIGFGKTTEHNLALLRALPLVPDVPVMVAASRKRFIGQLTERDRPADRDAGSIGVHLAAAAAGAALVRVHDVRGHVDALTMFRATLP